MRIQFQLYHQSDRSDPTDKSHPSTFFFLSVLCVLCLPTFAQAPDPLLEFERTIRPILIENCIGCHGPEKQKSGLRLDSREAVLQGGSRGPAIVERDANASLLIQAIRHEGDLEMPPREPLPQTAIDALAAWVAAGAPWPQTDATAIKQGIDIETGREFWSFQPLAEVEPPAVKNEAWIQQPIDRFILARLEEANLSPAPPADKRTLIRRATYDLIGLPPTVEEVDAFLADDSPDAFAKVVDRLLASPQYGERWGRHWLDVVRYTDSFDSRAGDTTDPVNSWRYRDWVVNSFNRDLPFNKFVQYQIAGDLIPDPRSPDPSFNRDGMIATAMLAFGNWPQGDADKEKMVTDIVDDQLDVVTRGFMGVTFTCARCHDHKFDPFTTADYYAMAGIFFSSHIIPGPGQKTEGSPILHIPLAPRSDLEARDKRKARIAELTAQIQQIGDSRKADFARGMLPQLANYMLAAYDYHALTRSHTAPALDAFATGQSLNPNLLRNWLSYLNLGELPLMTAQVPNIRDIAGIFGLRGSADTPSLVVNTNDTPAMYFTITQPARSVVVHPGPASAVAVVWRSPINGAVSIQGNVADADGVGGDGVAWALTQNGSTAIANGDIVNGGTQPIQPAQTTIAVGTGDTLMLSISPKTSHTCDTTAVQLVVTETGGDARTWDLTQDMLTGATPGDLANPHPDAHGNAGVWEFADLSGQGKQPAEGSPLIAWNEAVRKTDNAEIVRADLDAIAQSIQTAATSADPNAPDSPETKFAAELVSNQSPFWFDPADIEPIADDPLPPLRTELAELQANPPPTLDFTEGVREGGVPDTEHAGIHDVAIHKRGSYTTLGDVVPRRFPVVFAGENQTPITEGSGRLPLAKWVSSKDNPLTARVFVNRVWQHHFGNGIVRTSGNFGKQGQPPTHPELLDYLARQFIDSGWSIKTMHRLMMLSSTYRQSTQPTALALETDADNRLLSHMNRTRLEAEALRDAMLAVTGKLDATMGGPAVREVESPRRTLYLRTVRSDRTSYTALFDAADPTAVTDKRTEATVAPQALFLLNSPFALQQAEALADFSLAMSAENDRGRIATLYQRLYAREASPKEIQIGESLLTGSSTTSPDEKRAAWTRYCQVLLSANEFVFID